MYAAINEENSFKIIILAGSVVVPEAISEELECNVTTAYQ